MNKVRIGLKVVIAALLLSSVSSVWAAKKQLPPSKEWTREMKIDAKLLLVPVNDKGKLRGKGIYPTRLKVYVDGMLVHNTGASIAISKDTIGWWAYLDMSEFVGKTVKLVASSPNDSNNLGLLEMSDEERYLTPLYKEKGRPQFHFSQKEGWNNDPNGMFYHDGLYHMSWQCNPTGLGWGNLYWAHAVSKDLLHWEELPRILRPAGFKEESTHPAMGNKMLYSGSGTVDINNTLGKQVGDQKTLLACFTDYGVGDSLAYSTDNGNTYTVLKEHNPVLPISVTKGRDPKLFWYEAGKHWVIVTYRARSVDRSGAQKIKLKDGKMVFFTSTDLVNWTEQSTSRESYHECPDFSEIAVEDKDGNPSTKLGTKWVLFDAGGLYQSGSFDGKKFTPDHDELRTILGGSVKAGQCFTGAPDGRTICTFWARVGYGSDAPFNQGFSVFMDLSLREAEGGLRLYMNPIKELDRLHDGELVAEKNQPLEGSRTFKFSEPDQHLDIRLTLKTPKDLKSFTMKLGELEIPYDFATRIFPNGASNGDTKYDLKVFDNEDGKLDLRVLVDRSTVEVFGENGSVYYLNGRGNDLGKKLSELSLTVEGGSATIENLKVHRMKSTWK